VGAVQRRWEEQAERTLEDWRSSTSGKASRDVMDFSGYAAGQTRKGKCSQSMLSRWCHAAVVVSCRGGDEVSGEEFGREREERERGRRSIRGQRRFEEGLLAAAQTESQGGGQRRVE
jgi:hypothetical protein